MNEFLGFVPDAWLEDGEFASSFFVELHFAILLCLLAVYNACDDHVSDGMDAFEVALKSTIRASLPSMRSGTLTASDGVRNNPQLGQAMVAEIGEVGRSGITRSMPSIITI